MKNLFSILAVFIGLSAFGQTWHPDSGAKFPGATEVNELTTQKILLIGDDEIVNSFIDFDSLMVAFQAELDSKANDAGVLHTTGNETKTGNLTLNGNVTADGFKTPTGTAQELLTADGGTKSVNSLATTITYDVGTSQIRLRDANNNVMSSQSTTPFRADWAETYAGSGKYIENKPDIVLAKQGDGYILKDNIGDTPFRVEPGFEAIDLSGASSPVDSVGAKGELDIVFGRNNFSNGYSNFVQGFGNRVTGGASYAGNDVFGFNNIVDSAYSVSILGDNNIVNKASSLIVSGMDNVVDGSTSPFGAVSANILGFKNKVYYGATNTFGAFNENEAEYSTLIGNALHSNGGGVVIVGNANDTLDVASPNLQNSANRLRFLVGNGTFTYAVGDDDATVTNRSNAFAVYQGGAFKTFPIEIDATSVPNASAGMVAYDDSENVLKYHNGTDWRELNSGIRDTLVLISDADIMAFPALRLLIPAPGIGKSIVVQEVVAKLYYGSIAYSNVDFQILFNPENIVAEFSTDFETATATMLESPTILPPVLENTNLIFYSPTPSTPGDSFIAVKIYYRIEQL